MPDKEQSPSERIAEESRKLTERKVAPLRAAVERRLAEKVAAHPTPDLGEDEELVATLRGATRGLCSEDATNYIPRGVSAQTCLEAAARIEALHAEREKLTRQLRDLAVALHAKHYAEVEQWRPLNDPIGILSQIDNMTTGLTRTALNASPKDSPDAP
jgi:hypothetical protein